MDIVSYTDTNSFGDGTIIICGFRLPKAQEKDAIKASQVIATTEELKYQLDASACPPIVRLYEVVIPNRNLDPALERLKQLSSEMSPLSFKWGEIEEGPDYVMVWGELNEALHLYQLSVMQALTHLREGYYKQKYHGLHHTLSPSQQLSLKQWGWPWAEQYKPYLILAQASKHFETHDFELAWPYSQCVCTSLFVGVKQNPGVYSQQFTAAFTS